MLLPRYHRLRPYDLGAAGLRAYPGRGEMPAKVGIIPTGDELIAPGEQPQPGAVIEFNSTVLAAFVREWGATPIKYPRVKDRSELLEQAVHLLPLNVIW